jgi:hypothetical protein
VLRELHALRQQLRAERAASAKLFKGAFGAPPAPKPGGGMSAAYGPQAAAGGGGSGAGVARWLLSHVLGGLWAAALWLGACVRRLVGGQAVAARNSS